MTAPERIWAMRYYGKGDEGFWDTTHSPHAKEDAQHEYILHTRAALAASPLVQEIVAEAVQAALDDVTTLHRVIADIRMATVGSKPMLSELAAALVAWRAEAVRQALGITKPLAAELLQWIDDELGRWPTDTAYADDLARFAAAIRARGEG